MKNKTVIKTKEELKELVHCLRFYGNTIVFTNGCFDILHKGHVHYLQQAKKLGDVLIVGVNSDESIKQYKSKDRPINTLEDRIAVLGALTCVDYIVPFKETTPEAIIRIIKPHIHVKGGDYTKEKLPEYSIIQEYGGKVQIIPFEKGYSTTSIIEKIANVYGAK